MPWTERVSNEQVLHRAGAKSKMMKMVRQKQLGFLGHVIRQQQMESICVMAKIEGKRGRPRVEFLDSLAEGYWWRSFAGGITADARQKN